MVWRPYDRPASAARHVRLTRLLASHTSISGRVVVVVVVVAVGTSTASSGSSGSGSGSGGGGDGSSSGSGSSGSNGSGVLIYGGEQGHPPLWAQGQPGRQRSRVHLWAWPLHRGVGRWIMVVVVVVWWCGEGGRSVVGSGCIMMMM